ncbi:trimethylguanosine synthase-like [Planococcus citri]|uniref:trimethylguanosine synthase-like n=1 Tax=Planococcus citri TaxID=170843 RepID=UPI0031F82CB0
MFGSLKRKLFFEETFSPKEKHTESNDGETEAIFVSSTIQRSESADTPVIDPVSEQQLVSHEDHSTSQPIDASDVVDRIQRAEKPAEIRNNPGYEKYWANRYKLFSKYDEGIKLDTAMWYSVTPEKIAKEHAERVARCGCSVVVDAFCGAGGNAIQFALTCKKVITTDIDPERIKLAKRNSEIYGVADRIEFMVGDFFEIASSLKADAVFLSPPWGGPPCLKYDVYSLSQIFEPYGGDRVYRAAKQISDRIIYFLPRNIDISELKALEPEGHVEIERIYLDDELFAINAYFGDWSKS